MRNKIIAAVIGTALAMGASVGLSAVAEATPATPDAVDAVATPEAPDVVTSPEATKATSAPLHHGQPESLWYCAAHRPNGYVVIHSWPYALWNGGVGYWCIADFYGRRYQYWVHVQPPGSANSWQPWPYQLCYPAEGWVSYCQGPSGTHGPT